MKLNKNEMARVVIQALHNSDKLPAVDNVNVKREARASVGFLKFRYELALKILNRKN